MTTIDIKYPQLDSVAKKARDVAREMYEYSGALPSKINSSLSGVPGGINSNLSGALTATSNKARDLARRADAYNRFASSIDTFAADARQADKNVQTRIRNLADSRAEKLKWYQKALRDVNNWLNGAFGNTKVGKYMNLTIARITVVDDFIDASKKKALDFFVHGNGRYLINGVLSALKSIGKLLTLVAAVTAFLAAPGFLLGLAVICAATAFALSCADTLCVFFESGKAMLTSGEDPGRARWYGSTKDMEDLAKKETTDRGTQRYYGNLVFTEKVTGFLAKIFMGGIGNLPKADAAFNIDYSSTTLTLEGADRIGQLHDLYDGTKDLGDFIGLSSDCINYASDLIDAHNTGSFDLGDIVENSFELINDVAGFDSDFKYSDTLDAIDDIKTTFGFADDTVDHVSGSGFGFGEKITDFLFPKSEGTGFHIPGHSYYHVSL